MTRSLSLRVRLTAVILIPLLLIAVLVGAWAYYDAQSTAAERFDRSLLSTALSISRDVAVTGGDAPSEETRDLLRDTSGGAVFYHVYAPDGVFVTGYATPPPPPVGSAPEASQIYYDAVYHGAPVRALRFTQSTIIDNVTGLFTFTVWQQTSVRDGFVATRARPTFLIIASMIGALAVIVWFGVGLGLYPLIDLEEAIAKRSADDLQPIRRPIPPEVSGIVGRLNTLLSELSQTFEAKDIFISNAAHQLRNPIAGVLSLAESLQNAQSLDDAKTRAADVVEAARDAGMLANNLLALERARAKPSAENQRPFDAIAILQQIARRYNTLTEPRGVTFTADLPDMAALLKGDAVLFEQAVLNLLNNALAHGGPGLDRITLAAKPTASTLILTVTDNGKGIAKADHDRALSRFSQVGTGAGTGLGLPIARAIAESLSGEITLENAAPGLTVRLALPLHDPV